MKRVLGIVALVGALAVTSGLFLCGRAAAVNGAPSKAGASAASERCSGSCPTCPIPCKLCPGPGSCAHGMGHSHVAMM